GGLAHQFDGLTPDLRVGVGEAAPAEGAGVDLRGEGDGTQVVGLEGVLDGGDVQLGGGERVVEVDDRKTADLPGPVDGLQGGDRRPVPVGGVAVTELSEVPQPSTVQRFRGGSGCWWGRHDVPPEG